MPAKLERCVREVKAKGKARNAWAVCRASLGSDAEMAANRKKRMPLNPTRY